MISYAYADDEECWLRASLDIGLLKEHFDQTTNKINLTINDFNIAPLEHIVFKLTTVDTTSSIRHQARIALNGQDRTLTVPFDQSVREVVLRIRLSKSGIIADLNASTTPRGYDGTSARINSRNTTQQKNSSISDLSAPALELPDKTDPREGELQTALRRVPEKARRSVVACFAYLKIRGSIRNVDRLIDDTKRLSDLIRYIPSPDYIDESARARIVGDIVSLLGFLHTSRQLVRNLEKQFGSELRADSPGLSLKDLEDRELQTDKSGLWEVVNKSVDICSDESSLSLIATAVRSSLPRDFSRVLEIVGDHLSKTDVRLCEIVYWLAWIDKPSRDKANSVAARLFKAGNIQDAYALLGDGTTTNSGKTLGSLRAAADFKRGIEIPPRRSNPSIRPNRIAYVAATVRPYQVSGYSIRTHELVSSLVRRGADVECFARPGFPWSNPLLNSQLTSSTYKLNEVKYVLSRIRKDQLDSPDYVRVASDILTAHFASRQIGIVQAASNYRNALPALIAARNVGAQFVYEVRGLWELTAASKNPVWEQTERYALERTLERFVANNADFVFCITQGVKDELIGGDINPEKIALLPNGVDTNKFAPLARDRQYTLHHDLSTSDLVLVYAGSLLDYEGLDDVLDAVHIAKQAGVPVKFLIVGDGSEKDNLLGRARKLNLNDEVKFLGRQDPQEIGRYLSLADVVPIYRKPYRVCNIVSPLKPFEAMSMEKAVIVSDLPALTEIINHDVTGFVCPHSNSAALAALLVRLHSNRDLMKRVGANARTWVSEHRSWSAHADGLVDRYNRLARIG